MLNDTTPITSDQYLTPNQVTQHGKYWYYRPDSNKMSEVLVDYLTKDVLQVQFRENSYPTDLSDIPAYARFIKIKE